MPEAAFLHVMREEFSFSPRVSRKVLSTAQEMLEGLVQACGGSVEAANAYLARVEKEGQVSGMGGGKEASAD